MSVHAERVEQPLAELLQEGSYVANYLSLFTRGDAQRAAALLHPFQGSATCIWKRARRDGYQPLFPARALA